MEQSANLKAVPATSPGEALASGDPFLFVGLDMGGTLSKIAVMLRGPQEVCELDFQWRDTELDYATTEFRLYHKMIQNSHFDQIVAILQGLRKYKPRLDLNVTGGGAFKYKQKLEDALGEPVQQQGEMESIYEGIRFGLDLRQNLAYRLDSNCVKEYIQTYPFMVVNIGSGVSVVLFEGEGGAFKRVGGTSLGGSTFLGLSQKLLGTQDFEALIQMAYEASGTESVDLLFHEYYKDERDKQSIQGKEQFVCISLSNITRMTHEQISHVDKRQIARSLIQMIAFNIAEVASLYSKVHKIDKVLFIGNFILNKLLIQRMIMQAFDYFVENTGYQTKCFFTRNEGFYGALAMIKHSINNEKKQ